jgi:hypothetical protein
MRRIFAMFLMLVENESDSLPNTTCNTHLINNKFISKGVNL